MNKWFGRLADSISHFVGTVWAFLSANGLIITWLFYAWTQKFSSESQMPVNTFTTIITFLMVFLIQHTQNRNDRALHLKLDELIRVKKEARNDLVQLEKKSEQEIQEFETELDESLQNK